MADKVRAAVKVGVKETEIREFPMPDIPIDGALLKVEVAGICGSDVGVYQRKLSRGPHIMGHENVGRIAKLGRVAGERWGVNEVGAGRRGPNAGWYAEEKEGDI